MNEPSSIRVDEEGITGLSSRGRETFFWTALQSVLETESHFFVLSGPKYGFIIPKRAFDSPAQCAEFGAFLKRKWAEHRADAPPIAEAK